MTATDNVRNRSFSIKKDREKVAKSHTDSGALTCFRAQEESTLLTGSLVDTFKEEQFPKILNKDVM